MSWFKLKQPLGSTYRVDPGDIVNTKTALTRLGYYKPVKRIGIQPWTDDAMFNGIKQFQKDNSLTVDGFMRPGGPTENRINQHLTLADDGGGGDGGEEGGDGGGDDDGMPDGTYWNMPVIIPPNVDPNMPVLTEPLPNYAPGAYLDKDGNPIVDGVNPWTGRILPPMRGI
ncbi:MAG: peptidoglycan-binding domain-containing protein [Actinomycetota bacterium]